MSKLLIIGMMGEEQGYTFEVESVKNFSNYLDMLEVDFEEDIEKVFSGTYKLKAS